MSVTAQQLIDSAGRLIGAVASGESFSSQESADALVVLNQLLESLSLEKLTVFETSPSTYTLSAGKQNFTIGHDPDALTNPDLNAFQLLAIADANLLIPSGSQTYRHRLELLRDLDQIARIRLLGVIGRPNSVGLIQGYPFDTLAFDRITDSTYTLELWSDKQLTSVSSLDDSIRFPRGYERMLRYALAIELAAEYGKTILPSVADRATQAKMQIQSANAPDPIMRCDGAVLEPVGGRFDWRTGGY